VDLGSAADLSDPHGGVLRLAKTTSTTFANLGRARGYTAGAVDRVRRELAELEVADGVSTCVFGSWARDELTEESDYDWAVLVDHEFDAYEPAIAREVLAAVQRLGEEKRRPGKQGVFGVPIAVPELSTKVGLDADTNTNLTRRMLLLLESRELHGQARAIAMSQILDRLAAASPSSTSRKSASARLAHTTAGSVSCRTKTFAPSCATSDTTRRPFSSVYRNSRARPRVRGCARLLAVLLAPRAGHPRLRHPVISTGIPTTDASRSRRDKSPELSQR